MKFLSNINLIFLKEIHSKPKLSMLIVSAIATMATCYPVIFGGKSFVSPYCVANLVYRWWPPLPGIPEAPRTNQHFSDTGAIMWYGVPTGYLQQKAIFQNHELPLWNRNSHAGAPLFSQGLSMLGDPFHLIVVLGKGSPVAWDLKFLTHRLFFCFFFGLLIFKIFRSLELGLIFCFLGAYLGYPFLVFNHHVFFVIAYSPWILYSGLSFLTAKSGSCRKSGALWVCSNFACFNSGFIEVAAFLVVGLNLTVLAYALLTNPEGLGKLQIFKRVVLGALLFLGLSAPLTISFLVALKDSYTLHEAVTCTRVPLPRLLNLVDGIFQYPEWGISTQLVLPCGNFLFFIALTYAAVKFKLLLKDKIFAISLVFLLLWFWLASGQGSDLLIKHIPLVNRVGHTYLEFSYVGLFSLYLASASAINHLLRRKDDEKAVRDVALTLCLSGALVFLGARHLDGIQNPLLLKTFLISALGSLACFGALALYRVHKPKAPILHLAVIFALLIAGNFRYGLYQSGNDSFVRVLGNRTSLNPESPSISAMASVNTTPFRVLGLQDNLVGDLSILYNLEDIRSCAPLMNRNFIELLTAFPGIRMNEWTLEFPDPIRALPVLSLLNVKYLLAHPMTRAAGIDGLRAYNPMDFAVFENLNVWPRAFFSPKCYSSNTLESFIEKVQRNSKTPFIDLIGADTSHPEIARWAPDEAPLAIPAKNYRLLTNSTEFEIDAPSSGLVCLSETQASDFVVTVGGVEKKLIPMNKAFKGVFIESAGTHHITFTYRPRFWNISLALFFTSLLAGIALMFFPLSPSPPKPQ